jgi:PKD repeat protein
VDANVGDAITYAWNWGDGSLPGTGSGATHTYAAPGTYTVTMTATDGWGASASISKVLSLIEPVGNVAPVPAFSTSCLGLICLVNGSATVDPNGDQISYSWNFGDGTAAVTGATPSHTYLVAGTYTITLTATDGWNRSASTSSPVTVP